MAKAKRRREPSGVPSSEKKAPIINVILILILFIIVLLGYLQNLTVEFPATEAEDHSEEISRIEEHFHRNPLQTENEKYFLDVSDYCPSMTYN